jgi:hypothetical protein
MEINLRASIEAQIVEGEINPAYELGAGMIYTLPSFYPKFNFQNPLQESA